MLAARRTLRLGGHSAAGLAVVTATALAERRTSREIARRDREPLREWDLARAEVREERADGAASRPKHLRTIAKVSDEAPKSSPLSLEQLAQLLPGTGEIMASVGGAWWKCAYAARAGNWDLAAYFARRVRSLQRKLAQIRPKYAEDLASFEAEHVDPLLTALGAHDGPAFERGYAMATDRANELHVKWAKPYIRWVLPDEPPKDLDLEPGR